MIKIVLKYRRPYVVLIHLAIIAAANYGAFWLRFDGSIPPHEYAIWLRMFPLIVAIQVLTFIPFRLYEGLWRYASIWDLRNIIGGVVTSMLAFLLLVRWGFG